MAPITAEEAQAWGLTVEGEINNGNPATLNAGLSADGLLDRIFQNFSEELQSKIKPADWQGFKSGARESLNALGFGSRLLDNGGGESMFNLLRVRTEEGRQTALFRYVLDDGVNYYVFYLTRDDKGGIVYDDVYVFLTGERISATVGRLAMRGIAAQVGLLDRLMGKDKREADVLEKIGRMAGLNKQGDYADVLKLYDELPKEYQEMKGVVIQRYRAAVNIDLDTFKRVCDDALRLFGNDESMNLLLIDGLEVNGQFDKMLACIDALDKSLGGDPYLNTKRTSALLGKGDFAGALALGKTMVADEITRLDGYSTQLDAYNYLKQYADIPPLLKNALADDIAYDMELLRGEPAYEGFLASEPYQTYKAELDAQLEAEGSVEEN